MRSVSNRHGPFEEGVLVCSCFGLLQTNTNEQDEELFWRIARVMNRSRYQQILTWCGDAFDGLIVVDGCNKNSFSSSLTDQKGDSFVAMT